MDGFGPSASRNNGDVLIRMLHMRQQRRAFASLCSRHASLRCRDAMVFYERALTARPFPGPFVTLGLWTACRNLTCPELLSEMLLRCRPISCMAPQNTNELLAAAFLVGVDKILAV